MLYLFSMKKDQVLDFVDSLEKEDESLSSYVKMYEALSLFLTDFDFLKDSLGLTQQDVAEKMGTTQSAISRIASLKTNPSYKQLMKMSEAVGGDLLVTPMKDVTVQVPYDLQESVRKMAAASHKTTNEYLEGVLRNAIELERAEFMNRTLVLNKVSEPRVVYNARAKKSK
jgi:transcriptional regulator with XRE-family HTH domain